MTGYKQVAIPVHKHCKGTSSYKLRHKISLAVNSVTSFSSRPLEIVFYLGVVILVLSLAAAAILIIRRLFFGQLLPGWSSTMVALCFMGGLNLFCVGIVGIYLAKVFSEIKDRPYTVIRQIYRHAAAEENTGTSPTVTAVERC